MLQEANKPVGSINYQGLTNYRWFTWHPKFREFAGNLIASQSVPRRVALKNVPGCEPYQATYDVSLGNLSSAALLELRSWGRKMSRFQPSGKMCLLREMIIDQNSGSDMRRLFSLLRRGIVEVNGRERACLYSPVTPEQKDTGFLLHSDRFITSRLLLVFDDVEKDGSGASLFLSRSALLRNLRLKELSAGKRRERVEHLMNAKPRRDSFDRLYTALYPLKPSVGNDLGEPSRICFGKGQGYLIDDRHWLHGREACSGRVGSFRFHRLTF